MKKEQALAANAKYFLHFWGLAEQSLTPQPACLRPFLQLPLWSRGRASRQNM